MISVRIKEWPGKGGGKIGEMILTTSIPSREYWRSATKEEVIAFERGLRSIDDSNYNYLEPVIT